MNAETAAAAPGVTGASASAATTAARPDPNAPARNASHNDAGGSTPAAASEPQGAPSGDARVARILAAEGLEEETTQLTDKTQSHEKEEKQKDAEPVPGPDGLPEGEGAIGKPAEGAGEAEPKGEDAAGSVEEEPISEEHKAQWPSEAVARIHKLTAQREEWKGKAEKLPALEEQVQELNARLENTQPVQVTPTVDDPLSDVQNEQQLGQSIQLYEDLIEWATLNPDGVSDVVQTDPRTGEPLKDAEGNVLKRDYSAQEMAQIRLRTERILRNHVPARGAYIQQRRANDTEARAVYPTQFKQGTEDYKLRQEFLRMAPWLQRFTDPELIIGHYVRGLRAYLGEKDAKAKEKNGSGKTSEELKPFLRKQPVIAPPQPRVAGPASAANRRPGAAEIERAQERVREGSEGEEAEVELVRTLRRSQAPAQGAALV